MSSTGSRWSAGGFIFVLAVVAFVSAIPTFIFMWFRDDALGTRIAFALGAAVGLAVAAYCEFGLTDNPGHEIGAVMALGGGILGPLGVIRLLHDPNYPNEKWNPQNKPGTAKNAKPSPGAQRGRTEGPEQATASHRADDSAQDWTYGTERTEAKGQTRDDAAGQAENKAQTRGGASDRRWKRYFRPTNGQMTAEEAWEVLGLDPGASADDIRAMHHRLMTKLHPDVGGSNYLASKVNEARDILLRTERQRVE